MPKKKRKRADHSRGPNRRPVPRRQVDRPRVSAEDEPLMRELKRALYADHPIELLAQVSGLVAVTEPRPAFPGGDDTTVSRAELAETFLGTDIAATTAALHVIAALTSDELLAARVRNELATRRQSMPDWLRRLPETEIVAVHEVAEALGDGEDYLLDVRLPDGFRMTGVVYVDNNMGEVVKDGMVVPIETAELISAHFTDPDLAVGPVNLAWARARMSRALELGDMTVPPFESETWPVCRPLVRWLLSLLPVSEVELEDAPEWTDETRAALLDDFFDSPHGKEYDDGDHRSLTESLLWFGTDYTGGDPLRWSPVNVEILLADWFPRKVLADAAYLSKLPPLLRAFIRYSHEVKGLPARLTSEVLAAVDRWESTYRKAVANGPQGTAALVQGLLDSGGLDDYLGIPSMNEPADLVGGPEALHALDDAPLPDEAFDWTDIPEDVNDKVGEILARCDRVADDLLDVEHRTAQRRLLRDVVLADPRYFRGRAAARTSAAAITWLVANANDTAGPYHPITMAELMEAYDARSAGDRPHRFRRMLGLPKHQPWMGPVSLGSARYLVSGRRADLIDEREQGGWV